MSTVSEVEASVVSAPQDTVGAASGLVPDGVPQQDRQLPSRVVSAKVSLGTRMREIWRSRELIIFLVRKELKVKYKNSILGFAWSMLNPALVLAVYYVVFTVFLPNGIPHFALFLFSGLLAWNLFNTSLMGASGAIVNNGAIVKKVSFPREVLAIAQVGTASVFFMFQAGVLVLFFAGFHYAPDWAYMPLIPLALLAMIVLAAAISVFLSAVNVYMRDTQHLIEVLLTAWFWAVPVVYGFQTVYNKLSKHTILGIPGTHLVWIYLADPVTPIVLAFQQALYGKDTPTHVANGHVTSVPVLHPFGYGWYLIMLSAVLVGSLLLFVGAMTLFRRIEGNFAEEL